MKTPGNILYCTDDRGFSQLQVALYSLLRTAETDRTLNVFVFTGAGALTEEHIVWLQALVARYPFATLKVISADVLLGQYAEALRCPGAHWGVMTWTRCFIGPLLPETVENVVYMDIDTFVCHPLAELYELEMGENVLAAVYEEARADGDSPEFWTRADTVPAGMTRYFNSGVLVLNFRAFATEPLLDRIIDWYQANKTFAIRPDQDTLNILFWDRTIPLHPRYNYCDGWVERQLKESDKAAEWRGCPAYQQLEAILDPYIIHYWGSRKPWRCNHRLEGPRYEAAMRELGVLTGPLPGTTLLKRMVKGVFRLYHRVIVAHARKRLSRICACNEGAL